MHARKEYWILTPKNSAKHKQYYYFHAEFLEEVRYDDLITEILHKNYEKFEWQLYSVAVKNGHTL